MPRVLRENEAARPLIEWSDECYQTADQLYNFDEETAEVTEAQLIECLREQARSLLVAIEEYEKQNIALDANFGILAIMPATFPKRPRESLLVDFEDNPIAFPTLEQARSAADSMNKAKVSKTIYYDAIALKPEYGQ